MKFLAIESSCDETAAAILNENKELLSSTIHSQINIHNKYGGVVPELASRNHIIMILPVIEDTLKKAGIGLGDLDGIAVTVGPGLVGSLLVGLEAAKGIAKVCDLPLVPVNHIEGHLSGVFIKDGDQPLPPQYPFLGLIVSGGHSHLYLVHKPGNYQLIGKTLDDAAGEAFDKVSKMLGMGYPGGIQIDRAAKKGDSKAIAFPRALKQKTSFDFSFSGLKTSVRTYLQKNQPLTDSHLADICASFQEAVVDVLIRKSVSAARKWQLDRIVVAGGVAANSRLRVAMKESAREWPITWWTPKISYCTDNAAMIGACAVDKLVKAVENGQGFRAHNLGATPRLAL